MAKIIRKDFGRLLRVTGSEGKEERKDWRASYIGDGLIVVYKTSGDVEGGEYFIRFYKNEPTSLAQKYITTSVGKITVDNEDGQIFSLVTKNSIYTFERNHNIGKLEAEVLLDNIAHGQ